MGHGIGNGRNGRFRLSSLGACGGERSGRGDVRACGGVVLIQIARPEGRLFESLFGPHGPQLLESRRREAKSLGDPAPVGERAGTV